MGVGGIGEGGASGAALLFCCVVSFLGEECPFSQTCSESAHTDLLRPGKEAPGPLNWQLSNATAVLVKATQSPVTEYPLRTSSVPDAILGLGDGQGRRWAWPFRLWAHPLGDPQRVDNYKSSPTGRESGRTSWRKQPASWGVRSRRQWLGWWVEVGGGCRRQREWHG